MKSVVIPGLTVLLFMTGLSLWVHPTALPALASLAAPTLTSPADGTTLSSFGPRLTWTAPQGITQYHLQVIPINNDGPGVDIQIGRSDTFFQIPPPPQWYGLLPDMTYTWQVRVSDAPTFVPLSDGSWSPWASATVSTPKVDARTITAINPSNGATLTIINPVLQWTNSQNDVFYYELQLSKDATFTTDPAAATAMVYGALIHGGVTATPNSYAVPANAPLERHTTYYWRVRPRIQGDGAPVAWSTVFTFQTPQ